MKIKIMSWNIWHGKYLDEIIKDIKKINPDIIGLQEVVEASGIENSAKQIAEKLGYNYVFYKAFTTDRHQPVFEIGDAILSKHKILKSEAHFLSTLDQYRKDSETEPRIAIKAQIKINDNFLNIITVHLGYTQEFKESDIRQAQVDKLINLISSSKTILMGDFNCLPESQEIKKIEKVLKNADLNPTSPTWCVYPPKELKYRIDNIFVSEDIAVDSFSIDQVSASDHLPIYATLEV